MIIYNLLNRMCEGRGGNSLQLIISSLTWFPKPAKKCLCSNDVPGEVEKRSIRPTASDRSSTHSWSSAWILGPRRRKRRSLCSCACCCILLFMIIMLLWLVKKSIVSISDLDDLMYFLSGGARRGTWEADLSNHSLDAEHLGWHLPNP